MRLLTMPEVADLLRVRRARAYELARRGVIPVVHVGRQVRVAEDDLHTWIRQGGQSLNETDGNPSPNH